jgi:hypothetical protein
LHGSLLKGQSGMVAEWYYTEQGQRRGPVTWQQLQQLAQSGKLRPVDLVWKAGMAQWSPASSQPSLFNATAPAAPAPSPAPAAPPPPAPAAPEPRAWASAPNKPAPTATIPSPEPFATASAPSKPAPAATTPSPGPAAPVMDAPQSAAATPAAKRGMSTPMKLGLLAGCSGVALLSLCGCVIGLWIYFFQTPDNEKAWSLKGGESKMFAWSCKKDDDVEITLTANGESDMMLYVFKTKAAAEALTKATDKGPPDLKAGDLVKHDTCKSKELKATFKAEQAQDYYVVLVNMGRDQKQDVTNQGKLKFKATQAQSTAK